MKTNIEAEQQKIEREYSRLRQCYSDFTELKQVITELTACSADPVAAKKLNALHTLVPDGITALEHRISKDMQALNTALKQLQSRIKNSINNG